MTQSPITILHDSTDTKGRFYATVDGHDAELTYSKAGTSMIIIDHTDVPDALRGMGVGVQLVERAVVEARQAGWRVLPLCPFAKAQIGKHPEWQDVL